jgi:putative methyltransferase (TIGR04325 family)
MPPTKTELQQPRGHLARQLIRAIGTVPPIIHLRRLRHERHFWNAHGSHRLFRGIYPDFAAAAASIPADRSVGYDNEASARRLEDERLEVFPSDYPVLFWLDRLIGDAKLLFDLGGNVGSRYLAFRKHLTYPDQLVWLVEDVPAVTARGRAIAARENVPHLAFTTDFARLSGADILLASGVLQFLDDWIGFLERADPRPRHLLINRTPVGLQPDALTLHSTGVSFCPYRLFNRDSFIAAFERLGYRLIDDWSNPGLPCHIPLHPTYSLDAYSGFYFRSVAVG